MRLNSWCAVALSVSVVTGATALAADRDLRLIEAARRHDRRGVQALLTQGVDVNAPQGDGATALHWAAYLDDVVMVDLLIRARANANVANDLGVTPLFLAASNGNAAIVAKLLSHGANPNAVGSSIGETPLMAASRVGGFEAVEALIAHGADPNAAETAHRQTALMWAAANRHPRVVQALVEGGADVTARSGVNRVLVMVANRATDFDAGGSTPLLFAARHGDIESAKLLLAAGADVNDLTPDKTSVLTFAAHSGQGGFAAFLLEQGANPNSDGSGYTALHAAVLRGDLVLVNALLAHHADVNARLTKGTPVNRDSQDFAFDGTTIGATPFFLAAKFAEPEIMRALIAAGADPTINLPDGATPLMAAAGLDQRSVLGQDGYDRRGRRRYPIEIAQAAANGHEDRQALEAVTIAAAVGVDINATNGAGNTAVHAAVLSKQAEVVQWLAAHGARLDLSNRRGQTPFSIANTVTRGQDDEGGVDTKMVELLHRLGVNK